MTKIKKTYNKAFEDALRFFINEMNNGTINKQDLYKKYNAKEIDPDKWGVVDIAGVECKADAIVPISIMLRQTYSIQSLINDYTTCRMNVPLYFPSESGGINTSRFQEFKDRVDLLLFDLKMYYTPNRNKCILINAYKSEKTHNWLEKIGSFECLVDLLGLRGIFTDNEYNIYDMEYYDITMTSNIVKTEKVILCSQKSKSEREAYWSKRYYTNMINAMQLFNAACSM